MPNYSVKLEDTISMVDYETLHLKMIELRDSMGYDLVEIASMICQELDIDERVFWQECPEQLKTQIREEAIRLGKVRHIHKTENCLFE